MGISIQQWRCKIGCFKQPDVKESAGHIGYTLNGIPPVARCLVLLFLTLCGDVESNPGPKQSTLTDTGVTVTNDSQTMKLRSGNSATGSKVSTPSEAPWADMLKEMKQLNGKMDTLSTKLNEKIDGLNTEVQKLRSETKECNDRINSLEDTNRQLNEKIDKLESKLDYQQGQSKRDNLIFHGIEQSENETWEESENKIKHFIKNKLNIEDHVDIERAHRKSAARTKPQPIVAKFSHYKDRTRVLKSARLMRESLDHGQRVGEDCSDMVKEKRRKLWPTMQKAIEDGKRAAMRHDKLIIEGDVYVYDSVSQSAVRIPKR